MSENDYHIAKALIRKQPGQALQLIDQLPSDHTLDIYTSSGIPVAQLLIVYTPSTTPAALQVMRLFTKRSRDLNFVRDPCGRTLAHWAVLARENTYLKLLSEQGIDLNIPDKDGNTTLHLAASESSRVMIKELLDLRADANARNRAGCTPLGCIPQPDKKPELTAMLRTAALRQAAHSAREGIMENEAADTALGL